MTLRTRLVIVAASAVAVVVAGASLLVYFLVRSELRSQVDRSLRSQVAQISRSPGLGLASQIGSKQYILHFRQALFGNPFQLVDGDGATYRPDQGFAQVAPLLPGIKEAQLVARGKRDDFTFESRYQGEHVQLLVSRFRGADVAIQVVASLTSVDGELEQIRLWLLLVAFGGVGIAAAAGFLVARASLKPVRDLSDTAERVRATRDLSQRIHVGGNDELSRLAATFNAMLESLDDAARRQRRLVQDASHELRTPLSLIKGAVQQRDAGDRLAAELPAGKERLREFEAEEPAASGDEDLHAGILAKNSRTSASSRVWRMGGRLARTVRP